LQRILTHFICILIHNHVMDQCKCVASGFLANGGILGICHVKVNLKREFCIFFCKPGGLNSD
ncbi:hypothetical protein SJ059_34130, partial [Klebsiella aerogenes]|nr:hypothetical protein [Klebsiella aerogenes]